MSNNCTIESASYQNIEVNLLWSTGNVALDQHLMPTMNKNSLIQIGGPEKGQCRIRAEAS